MSSQEAFGQLEAFRGYSLSASTEEGGWLSPIARSKKETVETSSQLATSLDERVTASIKERNLMPSSIGNYSLFLTSNETGKNNTRKKLSRRIFPAKDINGYAPAALIVSGMLGLDFASIAGEDTKGGRSIHHIVHLDPGSVNTFFRDLSDIICHGAVAPNREEVIVSIGQLIRENVEVYWANTCRQQEIATHQWNKLQKDIRKGRSWLSSDERYQHIAQIIRSGNFVSKRVDITNVKKVEQLMDILKGAKLYLGFTYLSNISEYQVNEKAHKSYRCAVKWMWSQMNKEHSLQVDCFPRGFMDLKWGIGGPLKQRIIDLKEAGVYTDESFEELMVQFDNSDWD